MSNHTPVRLLAAALLLASGAPIARSEARLPRILSSHMVLQRERPIHIWGWADPGQKMPVDPQGPSRATAANGWGPWTVFLPPEPAGGPYQLTLTAGNKIV